MAGEDRTFKQLQKEKTFDDLNRFAKAVTEAYATSDKEYSQANAAQDNHLTKKGLRDLMDYAIVTALVSREICEQVLEKAISNQRQKIQGAGGTAISHHKDLMRKREDYLLGTYTRTGIARLSKEIADNPSYSIPYFTEKYNIESDRLTKKILERGIVENITSDEEMEKIIERSLKGYKAEQYFAALKKQREENKAKSSQK